MRPKKTRMLRVPVAIWTTTIDIACHGMTLSVCAELGDPQDPQLAAIAHTYFILSYLSVIAACSPVHPCRRDTSRLSFGYHTHTQVDNSKYIDTADTARH